MPELLRKLVPVFLFVAVSASAQSQRTEHTFKLDDADKRPPATLAEVGWLVGSWTGTAFGDRFEEVWNPPTAGTMVGMFKLLKEDEVSFYELVLLVEEEGSLSLKVKHFNADFSAWEEKEEYVNFKLVRIDEDAIHFSGISFYRISDDEIHAYLVLHDSDRVWEEQLIYKRN